MGLCALGGSGAAVCVCTPGGAVPTRACQHVPPGGRARGGQCAGGGVRSGVRVLQHTVAAVGAGTIPSAWALTRGRVGGHGHAQPTAAAARAHMEKSSCKHGLAQPEVCLGREGQ